MKDIQLFTEPTAPTAEFEALAIHFLNDEVAATIQGGWDLLVYDNNSGTGEPIGKFNHGSSVLSSVNNNKIGSVRINAGRWKFADLYYGLGSSVKIAKKGLHNLATLGFDNKTSSVSRY